MGKKFVKNNRCVVKKILRHKLLKRTAKQNNKQFLEQNNLIPKSNIPQQQVMATGNSLRSQLMNRFPLMPLGFVAQQYGNINNEKRINQLRQDNQMVNDAMHRHEEEIETLKKENDKLKSEAKSKVKTLDQLLHEKYLLQTKLDEEERKGHKVDILYQQIQSLTDQIDENIRSGNILKLQKVKSEKETHISTIKNEVNGIQQEIDENSIKKEIMKIDEETKLM